MSSPIPRLRIPVFEAQAENAAEAIRAGHLVRGPHLGELEDKLSRLFDKRHVVLTCNGFAALFAALESASRPEEGVLTAAASTCQAVPNAIRAAGHVPVFADIGRETASIEAWAAASQPSIAIVPDHFGLIADACRGWTAGPGLLIEDACQSFISRTRIRTAADVVVVSFYPTKLVNGVDGGALMTDDARIADRARQMIQYDDQYGFESNVRYNLKMNNLNAAVALGTLAHLPELSQRLASVYDVLKETVRRKDLERLPVRDRELPSRFVVTAESDVIVDRWLQHLDQAGIGAARELIMLCPKDEAAAFSVASQLARRSFSIPFHPLLDDVDLDRIRRAVEAF